MARFLGDIVANPVEPLGTVLLLYLNDKSSYEDYRESLNVGTEEHGYPAVDELRRKAPKIQGGDFSRRQYRLFEDIGFQEEVC